MFRRWIKDGLHVAGCWSQGEGFVVQLHLVAWAPTLPWQSQTRSKLSVCLRTREAARWARRWRCGITRCERDAAQGWRDGRTEGRREGCCGPQVALWLSAQWNCNQVQRIDRRRGCFHSSSSSSSPSSSSFSSPSFVPSVLENGADWLVWIQLRYTGGYKFDLLNSCWGCEKIIFFKITINHRILIVNSD